MILLQDLASGRYLAANDTWVTSCLDATRFDHTYLAALEGLKHSESSQVVWCMMENPKRNMYISVRAEDSHRVKACDSCHTCPLASTKPSI